MHPIVAEQTARLVLEDRHRAAAARQRIAAARPRPRLRPRPVALLVAIGSRLRRPAARPARHAAAPRTAGC